MSSSKSKHTLIIALILIVAAGLIAAYTLLLNDEQDTPTVTDKGAFQENDAGASNDADKRIKALADKSKSEGDWNKTLDAKQAVAESAPDPSDEHEDEQADPDDQSESPEQSLLPFERDVSIQVISYDGQAVEGASIAASLGSLPELAENLEDSAGYPPDRSKRLRFAELSLGALGTTDAQGMISATLSGQVVLPADQQGVDLADHIAEFKLVASTDAAQSLPHFFALPLKTTEEQAPLVITFYPATCSVDVSVTLGAARTPANAGYEVVLWHYVSPRKLAEFENVHLVEPTHAEQHAQLSAEGSTRFDQLVPGLYVVRAVQRDEAAQRPTDFDMIASLEDGPMSMVILVSDGQSQPITLNYTPPVPLRFTLTHAAENLRVHLSGARTAYFEEYQETWQLESLDEFVPLIPDAQGVYTLQPVAAEHTALVIAADGFAVTGFKLPAVREDVIDLGALTLNQGWRATLRVVDTQGNALAGVKAVEWSFWYSASRLLSEDIQDLRLLGTSGHDGVIELPPIELKSVSVAICMKGYGVERVTLTQADANQERLVTLAHAASVHGQIFNLPNAEQARWNHAGNGVFLIPQSSWPEEDPDRYDISMRLQDERRYHQDLNRELRYEITAIPPGTYIPVFSDGETNYLLLEPVTLAAGERRQIDFHFEALLEVRVFGRLTLPNGTPAAGIAVNLANSPNFPYRRNEGLWGTTDSSGYYEIADVPQGTWYVISVCDYDMDYFDLKRYRELKIKDAGDAEYNFEVPFIGATIKGRVTSDNAAVIEPRITVEHRNTGKSVSLEANPDGTFEIPNIGPGEWIVWAEVHGAGRRNVDNNVHTLVTVREGDREVEANIHFTTGNMIVTVTDIPEEAKQNNPQVLLYVMPDDPTVTNPWEGRYVDSFGLDEFGRFNLNQLAHGRYAFEIASEDYPHEAVFYDFTEKSAELSIAFPERGCDVQLVIRSIKPSIEGKELIGEPYLALFYFREGEERESGYEYVRPLPLDKPVSFNATLPPGKYRVLVSTRHFHQQWKEIETKRGEVATITLDLVPKCFASFTVKGEALAHLVANNVKLSLRKDGDADSLDLLSERDGWEDDRPRAFIQDSDVDTTWEWAVYNLPAGTYTITASLDGVFTHEYTFTVEAADWHKETLDLDNS